MTSMDVVGSIGGGAIRQKKEGCDVCIKVVTYLVVSLRTDGSEKVTRSLTSITKLSNRVDNASKSSSTTTTTTAHKL